MRSHDSDGDGLGRVIDARYAHVKLHLSQGYTYVTETPTHCSIAKPSI